MASVDELLKETYILIADTGGEIVVQGASGHTMTLISLSLCNIHASNDETFDLLRTDLDGSTAPFYIYKTQSLPALATFIHSDKIVLGATTELWVKAGSAATIDAHASYLDQEL